MWQYDDEDAWQAWYDFREKAQRVENEHLAIRTAIQDAKEAARADPSNDDLKLRVKELETSLADLERRAPWISWQYPPEVLYWGVPHG